MVKRLLCNLGLSMALLSIACAPDVIPVKEENSLSVPASLEGSGTELRLESPIDLSTYVATTTEATAAIDKIRSGQALPKNTINGGMTDKAIEALRNARLAVKDDGSQIGSRQPTAKPTTSATRPKITWLGKMYGPGETYFFNLEYYTPDYPIRELSGLKTMSYSEKRWNNGNLQPWDDYGYITALFQTPDATTNAHFWMDYYTFQISTRYSRHQILSMGAIETDQPSPNNFKWTIIFHGNGTEEYTYYNLASRDLEPVNSAPIQETWYWNPPWHFEDIAMHVEPNGAVSYSVTTVPGQETQTFIYRWSVADFNAAYSGAGGWHDQGWFIKDIDVEEGIVTAILFVPAVAYTEGLILNVQDDQIGAQIGAYQNAAYRGIMVDSSW